MNHPTPEEWVRYLCDEVSAPERKTMASHLNECPQCAERMDSWSNVASSLGRLGRQERPRRFARFAPQALKWGIAALFLIGLGFGFGRWSGPAPINADELRAQIEFSVRNSLAAEVERRVEERVDAQILAALSPANGSATNPLQAAFQNAIRTSADPLFASCLRDTRTVIEQLAADQQLMREQDRRMMLTLFEELQKKQAADYLSVRNDLETVASLTEEQILQARKGLIQLAAQATGNPPKRNGPQ